MAQLTAQEIAKSLNVSLRRVHQLVTDGMPKAERGRFDGTTCLEWYVRHLQRAVQHRESLTGKTTAERVRVARVELLNAQKDKLTRENAEALGQLVPLDVFREQMSGMILTARQRLLQMPDRIAPQLEGESRAIIKERLRGEIHLALVALATPGAHREPGTCDAFGQRLASSALPSAPDGTGAKI